MSKVEFYEEAPSVRLTRRADGGTEFAIPTGRHHRWRVRADNGEIVAHGEGYSSESNAKRGFVDAFNAMSEAYHAHLREGGDWRGTA